MIKLILAFVLLYSTTSYAQVSCKDIFKQKPDYIDIKAIVKDLSERQAGSAHVFAWIPNRLILRVQSQGLVPKEMHTMAEANQQGTMTPALQSKLIEGLTDYHHALKNTSMLDLRYTTIRSPNIRETAEALLDSNPMAVNEIFNPLMEAMQKLHQSYSQQGPERAKLLPEIQRQDIVDQPLVTHFNVNRWVQPLAHIQLFESHNPRQKLHVESDPVIAPQLGPIARRNDTELIGELGRLYGTEPNKKSSPNDFRTDNVYKVTAEDVTFYQFAAMKDALTYALYEQAGKPFDRVIIQINTKVEKVFLRKKVPLHLGQRVEVTKDWKGEDGKTETITEVVYSFDQSAMASLIVFFHKTQIKRWFSEAVNHPYFKGREEAFFMFNERDIYSLLAIDLFPVNNNQIAFPPRTVVSNSESGLQIITPVPIEVMKSFLNQN